MLPDEVRQRIHEEWLDWQGLGCSIAELSHRGDYFREVLQQCEKNFRSLLNLPNDYHVMFLHGGAQTQFALLPMNLLGKNNRADYLTYGFWAKRAYLEAKRYGDLQLVDIRTSNTPYAIDEQIEHWNLREDIAYVHCCTNETIEGIRLNHIPKLNAPLVADMSSDLLIHPIDIKQFKLVYGCVQKNLGIAGLSFVIIHESLFHQAMLLTPNTLSYTKQAYEHSLYNTPNTFGCYVTGLVLEWVQKEGGLSVMAKRSQQKATLIYELIDQYPEVFVNNVHPDYRSLSNIIFHLPSEEKEEAFIKGAEQRGLLFLQGHRLLGGIRVSIYNAMPVEGVQALAEYMKEFAVQ